MLSKSINISFYTCRTLLILSSMLLFTSCYGGMDDAKNAKGKIDPDLGYTREEFKEKLTPKRDVVKEDRMERRRNKEPKIPEISDILTTPQAPDQMPDKLISLSVTEDVPLKEVLMELSRLADVDMEIDPAISGGIIMSVKDRPFKEVIQRVVRLGGLRYDIMDGVFKVEKDNPYLTDYEVDFLNILRESSSTTNVDTNSLGNSENQSPSGTTSTVTAATEGGVWDSIDANIKNIIGFNEISSSISSQPAEAAADASASIQINKTAGIVSVIANKKQHAQIASYLEKVRRKISSQVLIEAKVVEVTLNEAYRSGIDWGQLADYNSNLAINASFPLNTAASALVPTSSNEVFTLSGGEKLSTAISFTETFGVTKTLSSPRLHAMNNQQAVLSFAENRVYFEIEVTEQTETNDAGDDVVTAQVNSTLQTVPVGVVLSLLPSVNPDTNEITMHVRPTLSRINGTIDDPAVDITMARINANVDEADRQQVTSSIPVVEVRELDSIVKMRSGEIMVIGGLMKDESTNSDTGVPFFSRLPFAGNLFKSTEKVSAIVETVIFIKATVVPTSNSVQEADKKVYKNFMQRDPRPLAF